MKYPVHQVTEDECVMVISQIHIWDKYICVRHENQSFLYDKQPNPLSHEYPKIPLNLYAQFV